MSEEVKRAAKVVRDGLPEMLAIAKISKQSGFDVIRLGAVDALALLAIGTAYLAEHPADSDEPIDEAWLRAVGFESWTEFSKADLAIDDCVRWAAEYRVISLIDAGRDLPHLKTRGSVRLLCRALGIELKEPTPAPHEPRSGRGGKTGE